jgi:hypothetical protein
MGFRIIVGEIFTYGYGAAPLVRQAIHTSPKLGAELWNRMFSLGAKVGAPMAALASCSFAYLRYQTGDNTYAYAAVFPISIVAFTFGPMAKAIRAIFDITTTEGKAERDSKLLDAWVKNWAKLNHIRASLPLVGALIALSAILA